MAISKSAKIQAEIEKVTAKIAEQQARLKELEQVCAKALSYSGKPSYKSIKNLLVATKDAPDTKSESSQVEKPHGITRGAKYYGGKQS